jgi:hypothetical protein
MSTDLLLWWKDRSAGRFFRTGVSLHSHTLHSREYLSSITPYLDRIRWLAWLARREARRHGLDDIPRAELSRAWWTPPLAPRDAWALEKTQIECALQKSALVSITDHDNIEAAAELRAASESRDTPVSLEWTVPYGGSWFHFGVHNLPPEGARFLVESMRRYTEGGPEELLAGLLHTVSVFPDTLLVLNHPLWDVEAAGPETHRLALGRLLARHGRWIHALEFNADRPWCENRETLEMGRASGLPVVGGGDRHGCHASPVLNLTDAADFAGFAQEVRAGRSVIALLPRLRESRKLRLFETACDVLRDHPGHARGWVRWTDRVFYPRPGGGIASLSELWGRRQPGAVRSFVNLMGLLRAQTVRPALRWALAEKEAAL